MTWMTATRSVLSKSAFRSLRRFTVPRAPQGTNPIRFITGEVAWKTMVPSTQKLATQILDQDPQSLLHQRFALSRAITLMESSNLSKKEQADHLLTYLLSQQQQNKDDDETTGTTQRPTLRVGFAGPPGAGKSSILEAMGMHLLEQDPDLRLAVVCVDPSSGISGGSILGDKTRMTELSRQERAYVRPSSNSGVLGGLAAYTDDVVTTLSAAGYPLVFIETVGLGQAETEVFQSVDVLVLMLPPGGGDDLQGVKKGIIELANILVVSKADGNLLEAAKTTAADYTAALRVLQASSSNPSHHAEEVWKPPVILTSSATKEGLDDLWESINSYREHLETTGQWTSRRQEQSKYWMWKQFTRLIQQKMKQDPVLSKSASLLESRVLDGKLTPRVAAQELSDGLF